ncbi:MAG TPA: sterol desaturase family protein, partial [Chryseosolibacter sp.]
EKLNFTTAARVPLLNFVLHNVFWIPLVLIGFDPFMIFTVESIGFLFAFYQHTQVIGKMRMVDWILNTPSHHRVHHASNPAYRNKNYGNVLIIFDRLFGTFKAEDEKIKPVYGLEENLGTYNLLVVVFHEWAALWHKKD